MVQKLSLACASLLFITTFSTAQARSIDFNERVYVDVGETAVIHGLRGECGKLPTGVDGWGRNTKLGKIYLGKKGTRRSRSCGGTTPAYQVIFKATRKGRETLRLFGDRIRIQVR